MKTLKLFYDTGLTPGKGVIREFVLGGDVPQSVQPVVEDAIKCLSMQLNIAQSSVAYLLQYGYDQSMQDSIAGRAKRLRDKTHEDAVKAGTTVDVDQLDRDVEADIQGALGKRHDAIVSGTVGTRVGRTADPLAPVARDIVSIQLASKGLKVGKGRDVTPQNFAEMVAELLADPVRRAKAQKESDRRATALANLVAAI
jgi:hypothetical protein